MFSQKRPAKEDQSSGQGGIVFFWISYPHVILSCSRKKRAKRQLVDSEAPKIKCLYVIPGVNRKTQRLSQLVRGDPETPEIFFDIIPQTKCASIIPKEKRPTMVCVEAPISTLPDPFHLLLLGQLSILLHIH